MDTEAKFQRFRVISSKPFNQVLERIEAAIGHPDMTAFRTAITGAANYAELEKVVRAATGPLDLMEFVRFDLGEVLRKQTGADRPRIVRLVVGNPLIMKQMVEQVPDAGSYAPVTILIDERPDGVHLSYDRMASLLASYENSRALQVGRDLDVKIESLLNSAARED